MGNILSGEQLRDRETVEKCTLAGEFPSLVRLTEIPGGRHNTLQEIAIPQIADALAKARE
jgi:hypothetical protein